MYNLWQIQKFYPECGNAKPRRHVPHSGALAWRKLGTDEVLQHILLYAMTLSSAHQNAKRFAAKPAKSVRRFYISNLSECLLFDGGQAISKNKFAFQGSWLYSNPTPHITPSFVSLIVQYVLFRRGQELWAGYPLWPHCTSNMDPQATQVHTRTQR